jgi:hypothetical protein
MMALTMAALPLALALRRLKIGDAQTFALTALYLFNPFYFNAGLWEFHEAGIACLFMALGYLALVARRKGMFLLALALLCLTKEHYGLACAGFGLLWSRFHRHENGEIRFGLGIAAVSLIFMTFLLFWFMPWLGDGAHPMWRPHAADNNLARYGWLHEGSLQARWARFTELMLIPLGRNFSGLQFLRDWLLGSGGLGVFAPFWLLPSLADLAAILLSVNPMPRSPVSYHAATAIAPLIMALGSLLAAHRLKTKRCFPVWLLLALLPLEYAYLDLSEGTSGIREEYLLTQAPRLDLSVAEKIAPLLADAPVSAQPNIAFLFAQRPSLYPFPEKLAESEYVVAWLRHPYADKDRNPFGTLYRLPMREHFGRLETLVANEAAWHVVFYRQDWLVLGRGASEDKTTLLRRQDVLRRLRNLASGDAP